MRLFRKAPQTIAQQMGIEFNWRAIAGDLYRASVCPLPNDMGTCKYCEHARSKYREAIRLEEHNVNN
jgi:hypothetical protein